ncbi:MAG TPA: NINE protein [Terriglobales bacterium]|nr:NINE protein [Terriglobales bacterium]
MAMVYCTACGKQIHDSAPACPGCGAVQGSRPIATAAYPVSDKRILPAFLLCFFLGVFGAHRFFLGKIGSGVAQLLTFGGLGLWTLADLIILVTGNFKDAEGNRIIQWT